jgi:flagellar protein FlbT
MRLSLRSGEKIYVNGAVLRVDRKVSIELMNDATFLLESHVMQASEATSNWRRLYFTVQTMLIDPSDIAPAKALFDAEIGSLRRFGDASLGRLLDEACSLVARARYFEALKIIRLKVREEQHASHREQLAS